MDFYEYKKNLVKWRNESEELAESNAIAFFARWKKKCRDLVKNEEGYFTFNCNQEETDFLHNSSQTWET